MKFIKSPYTNSHEVKQSKFIAHLIPFSEYEHTLLELKKTHQKARHFVVAYRYLNEFAQIVEHSSDDGEPKGTSGKPSLFVLQGAEIIDTAVIIVRYFGGTKLGTGGLVRAYSDAVNAVLSQTILIEYKNEIVKTISFEYTNTRIVEYECLACGITIIEKVFSSTPVYKVKACESTIQDFLVKMQRLVELV
jgi:uncharacterized YigZ family protein